MKKGGIYIFLLITFCLFSSCSGQKQSKEYVLLKDLKIGEENEDERFVFSGVPSIALDSIENIYILDRMNFRILKFDTNGNFSKSLQIEKGEGPEEVSLISSMAVTQKGSIYIFDMNTRKIIVYDESWNFLNSFSLKFFSVYILPTLSENVIILGLMDGFVFHEFSPYGEHLHSFGEPFKVPEKFGQHKDLAHLRIPMRADCSKKGRLFLANPHEYEIKVFENKELKYTLEHASDEFSPLELKVKDKETGTVGMAFPWVTVLEHKNRLFITLRKFGKHTHHTLHIFEKRRCVASLQVNGYAYAIDKMGRLYFSEEEDYPKMVRYTVREK